MGEKGADGGEHMSIQQELHYKDRRPEETIAFIQEILKELGISVEEIPVPDSSVGTCSLRVNIKGTNLGANGKGINRTYARASAYAEFMERLQNDILTVFARYPKQKEGFYQFPDEKFFTSFELAGMENAFLEYFFRCRGMEESTREEKAAYLGKYHKLDFFVNGEIDAYQCRPFYSIKKKQVEYLPYYLYLTYYASNGMSAGNSPQEAMVQGLSEILERHVQERIFLEKPALPDIPDEYIQRYPYIWEKVEKLRNLPGLRIYMKDCSFGGKYPVAGLFLVEEDTGMYGVKLGCHPDYGIAMERTITEAAQGEDISAYARRSLLDFTNDKVDGVRNIYNSYKFGQLPFPYEIFGKESTYSFVPVKDVSMMSNGEILEGMLSELLEEGYDVLVRDVSYTGFGSFHIIVPGMSEIYREHSLLQAKILNTKTYLTSYLNYPETIDKRIAKLIRGNMDYWCDFQIENAMKNHYNVYPDFAFPGEEVGVGWLYMTAMCSAFLEEYAEAAVRMGGGVRAAIQWNSPSVKFYKGMFHYLTARGQGLSHQEAIQYLNSFFSEAVCGKIQGIFEEEGRIFTSQYPRFDYLGRDGKEGKQACEYNTFLETKAKILEYMKLHPIAQEHLAEILPDYRA